MGLLANLFNTKPDCPELDPDSQLANKLDQASNGVRQLSDSFGGNMELVPHDDRVYVFLGKPPKKFGFAWIAGDKAVNLKEVAEAGKIPPRKLGKLVESMGRAYEKHSAQPRYRHEIAGTEVLVRDSETLGATLADLLGPKSEGN